MNIAVLLAAGKSTRAGVNKLWADILGEPLWLLSYKTFLKHPLVDHIIVVVPKGDEFKFLPFVDAQKTEIISGADTRMGSFKNGLNFITTYDLERSLLSSDVILDHNAANPNVTPEEISAVIEAAQKIGAAAVGHRVVDTVIQVNEEDGATNSWNRDYLRLMQTPQAVRGDILQNLLSRGALSDSTDLTTALLHHIPVKILPAHPLNKKITLAEDIELLRAQQTGPAKTFLGEDSHRFSSEGELSLGGLTIPECPAMEANSDGDVILHAIGRALAEACGENFSELADPLSLSGGQDSRDYVEPLLEKCIVKHVSISIEGARPRIDPLAPALKTSLAEILKTSEDVIHISAHTGEDLTSFGKGEGIRCFALVTISQE